MGHTSRLQILSLSCFICLLLYWFVNLIVTVPRYCWGLQDFWLNKETIMSPFLAFNLLFLILLLWALIEIKVLISSSGSKKVKASILLIVFISLGLITAVQYTFWQTIQILEGNLEFDDYWYKAVGNHQVYKENDENPMPRWKEFVFDQRCNNGLELHNISEDEYTELRNKYDQLLDQSYNNRGH